MDPLEAVPVARMLDEAGYDGILCSDHMIYPRELSSPYPDSADGKPGWEPDTAWPDPWVLIGAMAAVTNRLRFSNAIYVAPARPLLEVAKLVATASVLSQGRVSLAAGIGWMREEYELMGQDFANRGKRLDEMIPALRELWRGGWVSWQRRVLPGARDDDRTASACTACRFCAAVSPKWRCVARHGSATAGSATRTRGTRRSAMRSG